MNSALQVPAVATGFQLCCEDLTVCYQRRPAVHHVDLALSQGSLVGIVGPNGAGKTTLLHGLLGWLPWTSGRVTIDGTSIRQNPRRISYLGQRRTQDVDFPMQVADVVATGRFLSRGLFRGFTNHDRQAVERAVDAMGLTHLRERALAHLSGGQQQRTFVARALATGADILLLDEPLTGLDEPSAHDLLRRLREWADRGHLVVAVIHDLHAVRAWCTHTVLLRGELIASGRTDDVLNEVNRQRCFGDHQP